MSLNNYLIKNNIMDYEGNCSNVWEQMRDLKYIVSKPDIKTILEIGFNAGHSSDLFLSSSLATVTSFDLDQRPCVDIAKQYIDIKFPSRHTLIKGDSTKTIPEFIKNNKNTLFDIIFIDGGHQYNVAYADIINCKLLAHKDTIIIMDDVVMDMKIQTECSMEPTLAWCNANINKLVEQFDSKQYGIGRGMVLGKYIF